MSDRVTFGICLREAIGNTELVRQFDRLRGTNLSLSGGPIELMIDSATGRLASDLAKFVAFVWDCIWLRLPPEVREEDALSQAIAVDIASIEKMNRGDQP